MEIAKFYLLVFVLINVSRSEDSSVEKISRKCKCENEPSYKACVENCSAAKNSCEKSCKERYCMADCDGCEECRYNFSINVISYLRHNEISKYRSLWLFRVGPVIVSRKYLNDLKGRWYTILFKKKDDSPLINSQ